MHKPFDYGEYLESVLLEGTDILPNSPSLDQPAIVIVHSVCRSKGRYLGTCPTGRVSTLIQADKTRPQRTRVERRRV